METRKARRGDIDHNNDNAADVSPSQPIRMCWDHLLLLETWRSWGWGRKHHRALWLV